MSGFCQSFATGYLPVSYSGICGSNQTNTEDLHGTDPVHDYTNHTDTKPSFMNTMFSDIKGFVKEHRSIIYTIVAILLVDHFFLGNKLTARIKAMVEKLLGSVEQKVHAITAAPAPAAQTATTT